MNEDQVKRLIEKTLEEKLEQRIRPAIHQSDILPHTIKPHHIEAVFGNMYADNVTETTAVAATNTDYEVTGGFTEGITEGVDFGDAHYLTPKYGGDFLILYGVSLDTAAGSDEIETGVMINGVGSAVGTSHSTIAANDLSTSFASPPILRLSVKDQVSLYVVNHTGIRDVVMEHASLSILRVGR